MSSPFVAKVVVSNEELPEIGVLLQIRSYGSAVRIRDLATLEEQSAAVLKVFHTCTKVSWHCIHLHRKTF